MNKKKPITITDSAIEIVMTYNAMIRKAESIEKITEIQTKVVKYTANILIKTNHNRRILILEIALMISLLVLNSYLIGYFSFYAYYGLSIIHFCIASYLIIVCHNCKMILNDMTISTSILTDFFKKIKEKLDMRINSCSLSETKENNEHDGKVQV